MFIRPISNGENDMRTAIILMRTAIILAVSCAIAAPALAQTKQQTVTPTEAKAHIGQTVTVEGPVSDVHAARSGAIFIDMGGRFPDNAFAAVIFVGDLAKFPGVNAFGGKTAEISGPVQLYQGKPEIVLRSPDQVKTK
jgi:DNA/RNA endonuclease YhcR with UshA esterase domain